MIIRQGQDNMDRALQEIEQAVVLNRKVMELVPDDPIYQSEYGETLAWLADTQLMGCRLGDALISRQESVSVAKKQMESDPGNVNLASRYALTLSGLGSVAWRVGMVETAIENYDESRLILGRLSAQEPSNLSTRSDYLLREFYIGLIMAENGELNQGLQQARTAQEQYKTLLEEESWANLDSRINWVGFLLHLSDLERLAGHPDRALRLLTAAEMQLEKLLAQEQGAEPFNTELLHARFLHWQQTGRDLFESPPFSTIEVSFDSQDKRCSTRVNLFRQAILTGETEIARDVANQLLETGFFEPGFIRECRQYGVCNEGS
jgi:tetratricopeptide (TPR) repeat protein